MIVTCSPCGATYDDADRSTVCPHDLIMPADDLAQKKAALELLGRDVCFAHEPTGPVRHVQSVGWNGMVTLTDMVGEFAPHLFVPRATANIIPLRPPVAEPAGVVAGEQTIRERIDAGQYPADERGRALVTLRGGVVATITSTNEPEPRCITGFLVKDEHPTTWQASGQWFGDDSGMPSMLDIMPPGYVPPVSAS